MAELETSSLKRVLGQESAVRTLVQAFLHQRVPHGYLFTGPAGVGKRLAARLWAQIVLCENPGPAAACLACGPCRKMEGNLHPDLLWVDFERQAALLKEPLEKQKSLKIDTVRDMEQRLNLKPMEARYKIAVIDPADGLVEAAAHALLKILEEPPPGTYLILLSEGSLLPTIHSRCQRVRFGSLSQEVLLEILSRLRPEESTERLSAALGTAGGSAARALAALEEQSGLDFDWETAPVSELVGWCDKFGNPRVGRPAAERAVAALLVALEAGLHSGLRDPEDLAAALRAQSALNQNANVSLALQVLFLDLRRRARRRTVPA